MGGVPTAFESIDAVAAELGVRPLEMRGTLVSSLTKSSFAGEVDRFRLASKAGLDRV